MKPWRSQKGIFLVQALVLIVLMAFIVSLSMQVALGKKVVDRKALSSDENRQTAAGLESQVYDCLNTNNPMYGSGLSCADFAAAQDCINNLVTSYPGVSIQGSGSDPSCAISITLP